MTLSTTTTRVAFPGAGTTGPFAFPFRIFDPSTDLLVIKESVAGALTTLAYLTDYTVAGVASGLDAYGGGGNVTLVVALAVGETLIIRRVVAVSQPTSLQNAGPYFASVIESALDRLAMIEQQLDEQRSVSPRAPASVDPSTFTGDIGNWAAGLGLAIAADGLSFVATPTNPATPPVYPVLTGEVGVTDTSYPVGNIKRYGARGDGVTVEDVYANNAIDSINALGWGLFHWPHGTYVIAAALHAITASCRIFGDGAAMLASDHGVSSTGNGTTIQTSNDIALFTMEGSFATIEDIAFSYNNAVAATAAVAITLSIGQGQQLHRVTFNKWYDAVVVGDGAWEWRVAHCNFFNCQHAGINVKYSGANPDQGDMAIIDCHFEQNTAAAGTSGILYAAHGGMRVLGCKFLQHAYALNLTCAGTTSDLFLLGCSLENQDTAGLLFQHGGGVFRNIVVNGCEISALAGISAIIADGGGQAIQRLTVVGNNIVSGGGASIGLDLRDLSEASIDANQIVGWGTCGIKIADAAKNVRIGSDNIFTSTPTPIQDLTLSSSAGAAVNDVAHLTRRATPSIDNTAYVNIFQLLMNDTTYHGALVELVLEGLIQNVGEFARVTRVLLTYGGAGNVTVTAVEDIQTVNTVLLQWDVTTTPGSVLVGLKAPVTAGAIINATARLSVKGQINRVITL